MILFMGLFPTQDPTLPNLGVLGVVISMQELLGCYLGWHAHPRSPYCNSNELGFIVLIWSLGKEKIIVTK